MAQNAGVIKRGWETTPWWLRIFGAPEFRRWVMIWCSFGISGHWEYSDSAK